LKLSLTRRLPLVFISFARAAGSFGFGCSLGLALG